MLPRNRDLGRPKSRPGPAAPAPNSFICPYLTRSHTARGVGGSRVYPAAGSSTARALSECWVRCVCRRHQASVGSGLVCKARVRCDQTSESQTLVPVVAVRL